MNELEKAEAELGAKQAMIDQRQNVLNKHDTARRQQAAAVEREKSVLDAIDRKAPPLHAALAEAQRQFGEAEEVTLRQLAIHASAATIRLHALAPIECYDVIEAAATKIKAAARTGIDTPNNERYSLHGLIRDAIALAPVIDDMHRPVYELGATVAGLTDWPTRRKRMIPELRQLLADLNKLLAKISVPLEAA